MYLQLHDYIEINNILDEYQSGYRENYCCESAIQYLIDTWKNNMDHNLCTVVLFLDLRRAFETIDRDIMLTKLNNLGIDGTVLKWFQNYLEGRKQMVVCDNIVSTESDIDYGVPQGSVLGPMLFILYINDIRKVLKHCKLKLFADDMAMSIEGNSEQDIREKLNEDLSNVIEWFNKNRLKLNVEKTKLMVVANKTTMEEYNIDSFRFAVDGQHIEIVKSIKYLGVILDSELKFEEHVNYICKKISKKLGVLYRCSSYLTLWTRKTVFDSIVLPHFNFASTILYLCNKSEKKRLQVLQNRAMRIILQCDWYTSSERMLSALNWLDIEKLLEFNALKFIHKIKLGLMPKYCADKLTTFSEVHEHNTRHREDFILDHKQKKATQNSVFFKTLVVYNTLPLDIKNCDCVKKFSISLKNHLSSL